MFGTARVTQVTAFDVRGEAARQFRGFIRFFHRTIRSDFLRTAIDFDA
jgi:hypothetical protein